MKLKQWRHSLTRGSTAGVIVLAVSLLAATLLLLNRQYVVDQVTVWQYQPTQDVSTLAESASLNGHGRFLFYASRPSIDDASHFNQHCSRKEMSTAILGCYNGQNIFIYNVTDERLSGIREVTAAHEMLHAAYARLSNADKTMLHELLSAEYEKLRNDPVFAERMAFYERTEPGERDNELHSIVGTEVTSLGADLESYYKRYFVDREKIVALHQNYAKVFSDLQKRGQDIAAQLASLAESIETNSAAYNKDITQLNDDIAAFNDRANSGGFTSDAAFQSARGALVTRAENLETRRAAITRDIAQYNQLRDELTAIAQESEALNKSIDSSLAPSPRL